MAFGQAEADSRGVVPPGLAEQLRGIRAQEAWNRFDSVCIDETVGNVPGWFTSWALFAAADEYQWFSGRAGAVGKSYSNQLTERADWAQDIYGVSIQFIAPPGIADLETDPNDALNLPILFTQYMPRMMSFRMVLAESDEISHAPGEQYPAGYGVTYPLISNAAAPVVSAGNNGEAVVTNMYRFPEPIMLAAQAKLTVVGRLDQPMRGLLQNIVGPGAKLVPTGIPATPFHRMPNRYIIRVTAVGPRYMQLRGARSAAG